MSIFSWWRKRRTHRRAQTPIAKASKDAGIAARVDMVRLEAMAEAAYDAMYEARLAGAKHRFEEARLNFDGAIEAARRAHLPQEAARLTRRRDQVVRIYISQFRYSGGE
jgi:hypothetical protein